MPFRQELYGFKAPFCDCNLRAFVPLDYHSGNAFNNGLLGVRSNPSLSPVRSD